MPLRAYEAPTPRDTRASLGIAADAVVIGAFVGVQKLSPRGLDAVAARARRGAVRRAAVLAAARRRPGRAAAPRDRASASRPTRIRFVPWDRAHGARALRARRPRARHDALHRRRHDDRRARGGRAGRHAHRAPPRRAGGREHAHARRDSTTSSRPTTTRSSRSPCGSAAMRRCARRPRRACGARCRTRRAPTRSRYTRSLERALVAAHASVRQDLTRMHLHILGICGTFMGGIAAIAQRAGHRVTGCDANVYPPMSTQLDGARHRADRRLRRGAARPASRATRTCSSSATSCRAAIR